MSLGEKIYTFRTKMNLSQGDLADMLNVSRQSISKWETNTSVPDLDKIIKLSEIFNVTIDELVKDSTSQPVEVEEVKYIEKESKSNTSKIVGTILLCFGFLVVLLLAFMGGGLAGLIFGSPFIACGTICLLCKRNVGLWCTWTMYILVDLFLRYATGISYGMIWLTPHFEPSMNYLRLVTAWCLFLSLALLIIITVKRFSKVPIEITKQNKRKLMTLWVVCLLISIVLKVVPYTSFYSKILAYMISATVIYNIVYSIYDWLHIIYLTWVLSYSIRYYTSWKQTKRRD